MSSEEWQAQTSDMPKQALSPESQAKGVVNPEEHARPERSGKPRINGCTNDKTKLLISRPG